MIGTAFEILFHPTDRQLYEQLGRHVWNDDRTSWIGTAKLAEESENTRNVDWVIESWTRKFCDVDLHFE